MANWCNIYLSVVGIRRDVARFRKAAGALQGRINAKRSTVFLPSMERGETADLTADGVQPFYERFQRAQYVLQGRGDDYSDHFCQISRRFPSLAFVETWAASDDSMHGGYLFLRGRKQRWNIPDRMHSKIVRRHYIGCGYVDASGEADLDAAEAWDAHGGAETEMMEIARAHWDMAVIRHLSDANATANVKKR